ncbi:MAG: TetR/AcrR family transcriptional regulator [Peptococcaceae bacterium]|nr:TetR/AcrR family transcriptional regulator [Peptococcaceae bacterium]
MPKGSAEQTRARKNEIIDACAALYETMGFKDITIKEIGKVTSFGRTSIYNYFQTKEEIFLALLEREYDAWVADLDAMLAANETMGTDAFAQALAHTLEKRTRLLRLMSMNHYDMEDNSRMDNLVAFKKSYGEALRAVSRCLEKFFPQMSDRQVQDFIYAFFPFMFGIYPYSVVSDKQRQAMAAAGADYVFLSLHELTVNCIRTLLADVE